MSLMNTHLTILTGASRGMGLSMACQLLSQGHTVLCISRNQQDTLTRHADRSPGTVLQWSHDLIDSAAVGARLEAWLGEQKPLAWASATLINNAGMIPHIGPLGDIEAAELSRALRIGLEAPMQLAAAFLRATHAWKGERKILNISSGMAHRAMASQAAYCAAKAGMDHFTRCVALEEAGKANGVKVCSLAPGVIDTDMQLQLRTADAAAFPDQGNFANLKTRGLLTPAEEAARRVLAWLAHPDFGTQTVADVRS